MSYIKYSMPRLINEENRYWQQFIDGDFDALSVLFQLYVPELMVYGLKISQDEELVKDSIQEIFIQLIKKKKKINLNNNAKGLVYRLLRNQLIDEIKHIKKRKNNEQIGIATFDSFESDVEQKQIWREEKNRVNNTVSLALNQLSPHQKEILFLKYSNCLSYEEIAQIMEINVASARTLVYRTLKQVKSQLADLRKNPNLDNQ